jgi:hypothetical protein
LTTWLKGIIHHIGNYELFNCFSTSRARQVRNADFALRVASADPSTAAAINLDLPELSGLAPQGRDNISY